MIVIQRIAIFLHNLFTKRKWKLVVLKDYWGKTKVRVAKPDRFDEVNYKAEWCGGIICNGIYPVTLLPDGTAAHKSAGDYVDYWKEI